MDSEPSIRLSSDIFWALQGKKFLKQIYKDHFPCDKKLFAFLKNIKRKAAIYCCHGN